MSPQCIAGTGTNGGKLRTAERAGIEAGGVEVAEELIDSVGAGEDHPAIPGGLQVVDGGGDAGGVVAGSDLDCGELDRLGSARGENPAKLAGLMTGARHQHTLTDQ